MPWELAQSTALLTGALERLDQRDAEIRVIAEQFTDVTARLDRTENELSNVLGHLRVQTAEGERLAGELLVSRQNLDSVCRDLQDASGLVKGLERKNSALHGTMEGFVLDAARLEQGRSWRMTARLREPISSRSGAGDVSRRFRPLFRIFRWLLRQSW